MWGTKEETMSDQAVEAVAKRLQAHRSRSDSVRRAKRLVGSWMRKNGLALEGDHRSELEQRVSRAIRAALSRGE